MDQIALFVYTVIDFTGRGFDWISSMSFEQFVRVFWAIIFIEVPRYTFTTVYVFVAHHLRRTEVEAPLNPAPLVSVIVPALNEAATLPETIRSLREQDYPAIEIIVVDDGSTDSTSLVAGRLGNGRVHYHRMQERQGKSAALNFGIGASRGSLLVFMDSDSTLNRDCVSKLVSRFGEAGTGAVSGNLDVRNYSRNLLTWLQMLEYLITLSVGRRFKASVGILSIVPGAIGAFRRDLIERIGRFEPGPGNDSDLTIRTRKLGYQIEFANAAICRTTVPEKWRAWFKQRLRWDRNIIRNRVRKHRDIFNPAQANFIFSNFVSFLDTLLFVAILPVLWLVYAVDMFINFPGDLVFVLFTIFMIHIVLNAVRLAMAINVTELGHNPLLAFVLLPVYGVYRVLVKLVRIVALVQEGLFRTSYRDPFAPEKVRRQVPYF